MILDSLYSMEDNKIVILFCTKRQIEVIYGKEEYI